MYDEDIEYPGPHYDYSVRCEILEDDLTYIQTIDFAYSDSYLPREHSFEVPPEAWGIRLLNWSLELSQ